MWALVRHVCLLAALVVQSITSAGAFAGGQFYADWLHEAAHLELASHHHHHDDSLHLDLEDGPSPHVHLDSGSNSFGLPGTVPLALSESTCIGRITARPSSWRSPTLEGPLRPPRTLA